MVTKQMEEYYENQKPTWQYRIRNATFAAIRKLEEGKENTVTVNLHGIVPFGIRDAIAKKMENELTQRGYKAQASCGSDYRESWCYVSIHLPPTHPLVEEFKLFED